MNSFMNRAKQRRHLCLFLYIVKWFMISSRAFKISWMIFLITSYKPPCLCRCLPRISPAACCPDLRWEPSTWRMLLQTRSGSTLCTVSNYTLPHPDSQNLAEPGPDFLACKIEINNFNKIGTLLALQLQVVPYIL